MTRPREPLPTHLIRPEDVPAWLADSVNKRITTHRTDEASARSIREHGVRIERSDPDGGWGRGFYSATRPDPRYGDVSVRVAVRLLRPFLAHDPIADQELIDGLLARAGTDDIREALMAAGHDGVVVHWDPGDTWVVAYTSEQVRVLWRPYVADWKRSIPRDQRWGGCRKCVHFRPDFTCIAFPSRIPIQVASGEIDHLVVRPGQAGTTVFEPKPVREPVPQPS